MAQTPSVTINETKSNGSDSGNGTKAFAGVIGLLLVIAGVYAMIMPMNQKIDFLERSVAAQKLAQTKELDRILSSLSIENDKNSYRERETVAKITTLLEKFKVVESQFSNLDERVLCIETWRVWWNREMLSTNSVLGEKISQLERILYGKPIYTEKHPIRSKNPE